MGLPVGVFSVFATIMLFVPVAFARELGVCAVLGLVSGVVAVYWYAVTLLRLLSMGTIQASPAEWGAAPSAEVLGQGAVAS